MSEERIRTVAGGILVVAILLATTFGRGWAAEPAATTVKLFVDGKTGQVFAKPGPGRTPLDLPVAALPELSRQIEEAGARAAQADSKADKALNSVTAAEETLRSEMKNDVYKWLPAKVQASKKGFLMESEDGDFELKLTGYMQFDSRWYTTGDKPSSGSTFQLRRIRPTIEGKLWKYFKFKIQPDFGEGTFTDKDMYIEFDYTKLARLRGGKYKVPVGLEVLSSSSRMLFIERSLLQNVQPERDVGGMVHGELCDGAFLYPLGVFNGVPDRASTVDIDTNSAKDFAGRVFFHPLRWIPESTIQEYGQNFGVGVASTYGDERGALPTYVDAGRLTFFTYNSGVAASGQRWRVDPQFYYSYGPFLMIAEYGQSTQRVTFPKTNGPKMNLTNWAYQVQAGYVLTGEDLKYDKNVIPKDPFDPSKGTWGAVALIARWSQLGVDGDAFKMGYADITKSARGAKEYVIGLNWYLNDNLKAEFNYARASFNGGGIGGRDKQDDSVLETRVQVLW
ncbi:MAG: OprO/OprP family phosphate-selective porin [Candidatus Binataceae bacterium]